MEETRMDEIERWTDPWDGYGLRAWRHPRKSRLLARLKAIRPVGATPDRLGFHILRNHLGQAVEELGPFEYGYAYERLIVLDWSTRFRVLKFFDPEHIRTYARSYGPPGGSILGHYWYGLLGGEELSEIERRHCLELRRRERALRLRFSPWIRWRRPTSRTACE
jgi:hypothetical protein